MLKKTFLALLLIPASSILFSFKTSSPSAQVIKTIIIDAGHGIMANGGYNGAKGAYSYEDDICLSVAKKLVADISKEFPNVRIIETRPTKYITALHQRADIANQNKGDLFISIHVNAMPPIQHKELVGHRTEVYYTKKGSKKIKHTRKVPQYRYYETPNTTAKGTQTYIWGSHKSDDKEVAIRENAPMFSEENYQEKYGPIDVNSPEFVAVSLAKTLQFTRRSSTLAQMVEEQFSKAGRISGGPQQRQVGIWVLQATAMPSILVETGFITNPQEEQYLNSEDGQQQIADCITSAVKNYTAWVEKKQTPATGQTEKLPNGDHYKPDYSFLQAIENKEKMKSTR